ncbi:MAG: radical SAM protein, partial [Candidatus Sumerlaeia bacterium]|nr:radical SAM protein [Candidatus Sumerlaeia bacterium]
MHSKKVIFYLPGMFTINGRRGKYPALSITGKNCDLLCEHCYGKLLQQMIDCSTPEKLLHKCLKLAELGYSGCLITGGCSKDGRLPYKNFLPALQEIKQRTSLKISIHTGVVDEELARGLAEVGVHRVLIDVVGAVKTLKDIYKLNITPERIEKSLELLSCYNLYFVPHVVIGIDRGHIIGEYEALRLIRRYNPP